MKKRNLENALITGAAGMVGSYVDFGVRTEHRSLNITDLRAVENAFKKYKPEIIIHLAAEVDCDRCERDVTLAHNVNAVGAYNVALAARKIDALMVYVSTSAVFDGKKEGPYIESDTPSPVSAYGHSKYLGELAVRGISDEHIITRISWVFGGGPQKDLKFVAKILSQLSQPTIQVVSGVRGSPTYGKDLVKGIKQLVVEEQRGIFHMANAGSPTRTDVVREILNITNRTNSIQVEEVDQSFFGADHVARSANESTTSIKGEYMRSWQEALRDYIETEWPETIK